MAQSRDEVLTDLINRTECLEGNGKKMTIAGDFGLSCASAAEAAQADNMLR